MAFSPVPPIATRVPHKVACGAVLDGSSRGCAGSEIISPPVELDDDLFWLRDDARAAPEVLAHLRADNAYFEACTAPLAKSAAALASELRSRLKGDDTEAPWRLGCFWHSARTKEGSSYPIYCRRPLRSAGAETGASPGAEEEDDDEVVLDVNAIADGHQHCDVQHMAFSADQSLLAFTVDFSGSEEYAVRVRRLGLVDAAAEDEVSGVYGAVEFGADNSHLFYLTLDAAHRPHRFWRHALGTPQSADVCLLQEDDERFWLWLSKSASGDFLLLRAASKLEAEVIAVPLSARAIEGALGAGAQHFATVGSAPAASATLPLRLVVRPRERGVLYSVDHFRAAEPDGDVFVVCTNAGGAKNFRVAVAAISSPAVWVDVVSPSETRYVTDVLARRNFWAIAGREDGFANLWVVDAESAAAMARFALTARGAALVLQRVPPLDAVFVTDISSRNVDYDAPACRFTYTSPTTPTLTCACRPLAPGGEERLAWPATKATASWYGPAEPAHGIAILKAQEVPNIDLRAYTTALLFAPTADGRRIPISLVFRPSAHALHGGGTCPLAAPAPLHLYAYGAYGLCEEPSFSVADLSLCDRGVVHAIAHVRGGSECGRAWYEDEGRLSSKGHTFSDYLACVDHLIVEGWTRAGLVAAEGGSAGGLLMGVVTNARPELFACVFARVPFLDAVVTMCDPSIPLVSTEWDEWGNPNTAEALAYMLAYDPMRNVRPQAYPALYLSAGLNDSRVGYWEPAKFCQRVRAVNTGSRRILFRCELDEGHSGAQDRFRSLRDRALELAWMLDALGLRAQ